jgi:hypothetical protein
MLLRLFHSTGYHHVLQNTLKGHGVTAPFVRMEKMAVARPLAIFIVNRVGIVLTGDGSFEAGEVYAVALIGVALGLFNLANHAGVRGGFLTLCGIGWMHHILQYTLKRYGMAAPSVRLEETGVTFPCGAIIFDGVRIVGAI